MAQSALRFASAELFQELVEKLWICISARLQSCRKRRKMNAGFTGGGKTHGEGGLRRFCIRA